MGKCHDFMTQRLQPEIARSLDGALLWCCFAALAMGLQRAFQCHPLTRFFWIYKAELCGFPWWPRNYVLVSSYCLSIKTGLHCALWLKFKQHITPAIFTLYNGIFFFPPELLKGTVGNTKFQQCLGYLLDPPRQTWSKAPSGPKWGSRWSLDSGWPLGGFGTWSGLFLWMLVAYTTKTMSINFVTTILGDSVSKALIMFSAS